MKLTSHFDLREFIHPEIHAKFGDNSLWFIDYKLVHIAQFLRDELGKSITINNWHTGGVRKESGLRLFNTDTGGLYSQHKYGKAIDILVDGMKPTEVHDFIRKEWAELSLLGMTTVEDVEDTPTWTHIDTRNWQDNILHVVNPKK